MLGSENLVTVVTLLPRVKKREPTHDALLVRVCRTGFSLNVSGEISGALYLILSLHIIFKKKFTLMRKSVFLRGILKDTDGSCVR